MSAKDQIISKIGKSKLSAGLELVLFSDDTQKMNLSLLRRKGTMIEKLSDVSSNIDYALINKTIGISTPLNIVVSGHGIITKKISTEGVKENEFIHKVLPNANEKDFYIQNISIDVNHAFVSLVRKEVIDRILNELSTIKLEVISCSFGPFCINNLLSIICPESNNNNVFLTVGAYKIGIKEGAIDAIQMADDTSARQSFRIGEDDIGNNNLVAYSSALAYFTQDSTTQPVIPAVKKSSSDYVGKRVFSFLSKGVLAAFLIILLANYFLFNHFYNKQNNLEAILDTQKSSIEKYGTLKSALKEKEEFLQKSGFLGEPKTSYYADQLAKDVPPAITLNEMNINPQKKSKDQEATGVEFSSGVVELLGICKDIIEFNNWVRILKELKWIKELKVLNYAHDKESNQNRFSIEVYIN